MAEEKKTKKELEELVEDLEGKLSDLTTQLQQLSTGFQNQQEIIRGLNTLVMKYEETINIITARLIEARPQS